MYISVRFGVILHISGNELWILHDMRLHSFLMNKKQQLSISFFSVLKQHSGALEICWNSNFLLGTHFNSIVAGGFFLSSSFYLYNELFIHKPLPFVVLFVCRSSSSGRWSFLLNPFSSSIPHFPCTEKWIRKTRMKNILNINQSQRSIFFFFFFILNLLSG